MSMRAISRSMVLPVVLCGLSVAPMMARAQNDGTNGPPKVLWIVREYTKPGKGGMMHEKTEGALVQALQSNHVNFHYLALTSLSGPDRALFLSGFASFADMETAEKSMDANPNPAAAAAIERANVADGDLLSSSDESTWVRRDDMSMNSHGLMGDRYMQISSYTVRPGHGAEWEELVKMVKAGYAKGVPDGSWDMFENHYGSTGEVYLVVTLLKSMSEVDGMLGSDKAFADAMGADGMKKMGELEARCIESQQRSLFAISPAMSNPPEEWVKAEPEFWAPKKLMTGKKKEEMKPMQ